MKTAWGNKSLFENGRKGQQVLILAVQPIINRKLKKAKYGKDEECSQGAITSTMSSKRQEEKERKC